MRKGDKNVIASYTDPARDLFVRSKTRLTGKTLKPCKVIRF